MAELLTELKTYAEKHLLALSGGTPILTINVPSLVEEEEKGTDPLLKRLPIICKWVQPNRTILSLEMRSIKALSELPEESLHFIILNFVFDWPEDPTEVLDEIFRVLKREGSICISTGSGEHPYLPQDIKRLVLSSKQYRNNLEAKKGVRKNPTESELKNRLVATGFHTIKTELSTITINTGTTNQTITFMDMSTDRDYLGNKSKKLQASLWNDLTGALEKHLTKEGIQFEVTWLFAVGSKP